MDNSVLLLLVEKGSFGQICPLIDTAATRCSRYQLKTATMSAVVSATSRSITRCTVSATYYSAKSFATTKFILNTVKYRLQEIKNDFEDPIFLWEPLPHRLNMEVDLRSL